MREKIEGTILVADGAEGGQHRLGRYAGLAFGGPGAFVQVDWTGHIIYASCRDRFWIAGYGTEFLAVVAS